MRAEDCSLTITIPNGGTDAHISMTEPNGVAKQKTVSVDDIVSNLASSYRFSSGLVPKGTRFFCGTPTDYLIGIESEARVRRLEARGNENRDMMIPFPMCLFVFSVRARRIRQTWVLTLKRPLETENDLAYNFPFGNTYSDGHVCWGEARLPEIHQPMELVGIINMFLDSGFNGDLVEDYNYIPPTNYEEGEHRVECFWSLLRYLEGKDVYPEEMLRENGRTLQQIMRFNGE